MRTAKLLISLFLALSLMVPSFLVPKASAQPVKSIIFPIIGAGGFSDTFGAPRGSDRFHKGIDIFGKKMQALVAVADGTVGYVPYPEASFGFMVSLRDKEGYEYQYIHLNNDTPGTDDGRGGGMNAYAVDIVRGNPVVAGQLIGYVGDSGNAETTPPHLHFEMYAPDGTLLNPYETLLTATRIGAPVDYPALPGEILPYGNFKGGGNIATGNFDGDSTPDYVVAPRDGGGPHVKINSDDGNVINEFMAYIPQFRGGVDLAAADVDGDGIDEIITAPGPGGGPHVRIFKINGTEVAGFMAYDAQFRGGVRVSAADMDNDNKAEIITAPGPGGGPHVRIFKADGSPFAGFMAYDAQFRGGVDIAAVGRDITNPPLIVTAPGPGGGPHVRVFTYDGAERQAFMAYDPEFKGGVKVSLGNISRSTAWPEILTVPASLGGPHVKMFDLDGGELDGRMEFEEWWIGGYDIAAGNNRYYIASSQGRRLSIRENDF